MGSVNKINLDRPWFRPGSPSAHLFTGSLIVLATAARLAFVPHPAETPFILFFPAVILVVFLAGSAAGVLAIGLSLLAAWLFIISSSNAYLPFYQSGAFSVGAASVVAVIALMRGATLHIRRANDALVVSEEKFRSLLESAPDAMVILDARFNISLINVQTEFLFGHPRAELLGKSSGLLIADRHRPLYLEQVSRFMTGANATTSSHVIELCGVRGDGAEFPIETSLSRLKTGADVLVSIAIRDITERKEIDIRLAKANKAKSDFLASMSHELRTPLNAIIGFSEMIRDAMIGPLDARYRDYGADINEAGQHLRDLINDILDISKIEGSRLTLRDEMVSIGDTAEACCRIISAMARSADVTLTVDVDHSLPQLRLDQLRFQQILLNLMSNAVKFTPAGGRVNVLAAMEPEGPVITVEDTGIGMTAEEIAIALEPFRQIEGPLSRRFDGSGLGLPLAKALIELHGGRLEIESAPGVGTTMRVQLPSERIVDVADCTARIGKNAGAIRSIEVVAGEGVEPPTLGL